MLFHSQMDSVEEHISLQNCHQMTAVFLVSLYITRVLQKTPAVTVEEKLSFSWVSLSSEALVTVVRVKHKVFHFPGLFYERLWKSLCTDSCHLCCVTVLHAVGRHQPNQWLQCYKSHSIYNVIYKF